MATFRLRHFSSPHVLRGISPERLLSFLGPYREFFQSRDYELPTDATEEIDYEGLVSIFMTPTEDSPGELLDALFLVDEMSTPFSMATLIDIAEEAGYELEDGDDHTPADIAIQIWLLDPDILERKHAEQFLFKRKSFEYFQSANDPPPEFPGFPAATRRRMEQEMNDWFESKKRGRGVRVFAYPDENEVRFLVRHGEPFKREETMSGADVGSVCYRPLKYDVVVYDRRVGELRINASLVGEKRFYRQQFGKHIFGDADHFPGNAKYTLEPLREYGAASLNCFEVDEIESIRLTEVQFLSGGPHGLVEILKASDVFSALADAGRDFPERDRIIKAGFKVKFADSKTPRSVKIRPANIADYTRDADANAVERWLALRGFIINQEAEQHGEVAQTVAGT
ncbi:hypothetical protein [Bremerella sp. P1]|uniref:hypothetical protein n=1 Tax=Bremerella sp. P1 TaxID=3026424 RepID=UPI0023684F85|nr:hypothetical protein [Bremerella sp. P1]WDI40483.1 hypothetical protein PSR63_18570 [Bremerella sp. P1]